MRIKFYLLTLLYLLIVTFGSLTAACIFSTTRKMSSKCVLYGDVFVLNSVWGTEYYVEFGSSHTCNSIVASHLLLNVVLATFILFCYCVDVINKLDLDAEDDQESPAAEEIEALEAIEGGEDIEEIQMLPEGNEDSGEEKKSSEKKSNRHRTQVSSRHSNLDRELKKRITDYVKFTKVVFRIQAVVFVINLLFNVMQTTGFSIFCRNVVNTGFESCAALQDINWRGLNGERFHHWFLLATVSGWLTQLLWMLVMWLTGRREAKSRRLLGTKEVTLRRDNSRSYQQQLSVESQPPTDLEYPADIVYPLKPGYAIPRDDVYPGDHHGEVDLPLREEEIRIGSGRSEHGAFLSHQPGAYDDDDYSDDEDAMFDVTQGSRSFPVNLPKAFAEAADQQLGDDGCDSDYDNAPLIARRRAVQVTSEGSLGGAPVSPKLYLIASKSPKPQPKQYQEHPVGRARPEDEPLLSQGTADGASHVGPGRESFKRDAP